MMNNVEEFDVVVAGCGLSGLTTAYELLKKRPDLRVCIVEARERMGGRLKTVVNSKGKEVDMGGTWIGPRQTYICSLLEELGIESFPQFLEGVNIHDDGRRLHTYRGTIPSISLISLLDTHFMLGKLEKLVRTVDLQDPQLCPKAEQWDSISLYEFGRKQTWTKQAESLLAVACRLVLGYEPEQISLLYFLYYCATAGGTRPLLDSDGGGQDSRIKGGTIRVLSSLRDNVTKAGGVIYFTTSIQSVDYSQRNIVVTCSSQSGIENKILTARRLIFSIPPSSLSQVKFSPEPPPWKQSLWRLSKAGCVIKIVVFYDAPFWRNDGFSGSCVCEHSNVGEGRPLVGVFDYCDEDENCSYGLCCFVSGNVGEEFSAYSLEEQRSSVCAHLVALFGEEAKEDKVQEMLIMNWLHDPDASTYFGGGGCPVDISALGFFRKHVEHLRRPLCNAVKTNHLKEIQHDDETSSNPVVESKLDSETPVVFFGGTETALQWAGYMDGAVESGLRVTEEVLNSLVYFS